VSERGWSRRRFLSLLALPALDCDPARPQRGLLGAMERWNGRVQQALFDPARMAAELAPEQETPLVAFPNYFVAQEVPLAPAGWCLRVGGAVARPRSFTLAELQALPRTSTRVRHHCVEGWSAVASWQGVRLAEIAARVGADPAAPYVEFRSFDVPAGGEVGYASSWDRASALHPQTLLAYGMNGAPLSPGHGAPLRLYGAVKLGYKMVKYLTEVTFRHERSGGYWEDRGYEWFAGV
jgi:DMSO/TMAO reductase YedYZ molybdopterin-dependent catalytic subunit